jgi:hypothetical protein
MTAGPHEITVEYYEATGQATIQLDWTLAGTDCATAGGWAAEFFTGTPTLTTGPVLTRCDPAVNFTFGTGSPDPALPADNFSARWTTTATFTAGIYSFDAVSDDGVRVYVDGTRVIDEWRGQAPTAFQALVPMTAGPHEITVEYYEATGQATIQLDWTPAG